MTRSSSQLWYVSVVNPSPTYLIKAKISFTSCFQLGLPLLSTTKWIMDLDRNCRPSAEKTMTIFKSQNTLGTFSTYSVFAWPSYRHCLYFSPLLRTKTIERLWWRSEVSFSCGLSHRFLAVHFNVLFRIPIWSPLETVSSKHDSGYHLEPSTSSQMLQWWYYLYI